VDLLDNHSLLSLYFISINTTTAYVPDDDEMTDNPSKAFKDLRDILRTTTPDIDGLLDHLTRFLDALSPDSGSSVQSIYSAIQRYLPSLQIHLLTQTIPNYLHALDDAQTATLRDFFVPPRQRTNDQEEIYISRGVALVSYLTLPGLLNGTPTVDLAVPSRLFLLDILDRLGDWGVDDIYWAVWSDLGKGEKGDVGRQGGKELLWEETTRSLVAIPSKCTNAVGRWKSESWSGDLPERLAPK
jgi:hypothetical protein